MAYRGDDDERSGAEEPRQKKQQGRFFEDLARLGSTAKGAVREQVKKLLADMDLVTREEFDAVKAMVVEARTENERLARRLAELEARSGAQPPVIELPDRSGGDKPET